MRTSLKNASNVTNGQPHVGFANRRGLDNAGNGNAGSLAAPLHDVATYFSKYVQLAVQPQDAGILRS